MMHHYEFNNIILRYQTSDDLIHWAAAPSNELPSKCDLMFKNYNNY